jgi:hypothetical protein
MDVMYRLCYEERNEREREREREKVSGLRRKMVMIAKDIS